MSFFYMMDDLRYFFFSFFFPFFLSFSVVVVVGLARDGCLVRSWVGVTQWGWRSPKRAQRLLGVSAAFVGVGMRNKRNPANPARAGPFN